MLPMEDITPSMKKVVHIGIMHMMVLVSSTSVTVQSFHLVFYCSSGNIIAALSRHLQIVIAFLIFKKKWHGTNVLFLLSIFLLKYC